MPDTRVCLSLLVIASLNWGCSPVANLVTPDAGKLDKLPAGYGVVALRVADLAGDIPLERATFEYTQSDPRQATRSYRIEARSISKRGISEFIGVVKAGRYSLSELLGKVGFGLSVVERRIDSTPGLGTFTVSPARLTNLGTVYYYPAPSGNSYRNLLTRDDTFPDLDDALAADYAATEASLANLRPALGWDENTASHDTAASYPSMALNPVALDQAFAFDDEVVILSRAGSMLRGKAGEGWRPDAVDSDTAIVFVDKNARGDMIAVTEDGGLFLQPADETGWVSVTQPDFPGSISAATIDERRMLHVFLRRKYTITVFEAQADDDPAWTARIGYRPDLGWQALPDGEPLQPPSREPRKPGQLRRTVVPDYGPLKHVSFARAGQRLALTVQSRLYVFDNESVAITDIDTGFDIRKLSSNGRLLITGEHTTWETTEVGRRWSSELNGPWRAQQLTVDLCRPDSGTPCETFKMPRAFRYDYIRHAANPCLTADGTLYSIILPTPRSEDLPFLASYRPGAKSWKQVFAGETFPQYCNRVFPSGQEGILIIGCSGATGKLYEYDIARGAYTLVREPEAFWTRPKPPPGVETERPRFTHAH